MICPNCGEHSSDEALFCIHCGTALTAEATQRQASLPETLFDPTAVPNMIMRFNGGAFLIPLIWSFYHRLWGWCIIFLVLKVIPFFYIKSLIVIPFLLLHIILAIVFASSCNKLVWKRGFYNNAGDMLAKQDRWATAGAIIILLIFGCIFINTPGYIPPARDKSNYVHCVEALSGVKVAQEMYISDIGTYADSLDKLAMYMIPGCTDPTGAAAGCEILERLERNCKKGTINLKTIHDGYDYNVTGTAEDRFSCKICVNPKGYEPEKYSDCKKNMTLKCPE